MFGRLIVLGTYSLAQRTALADGNLVTLLDTESGGNVGGEVLVALLVTGVLGDEVEVLAADDEGTVHLGGNDGAGEDTATDRDETGEGALLVCGTRLAFPLHSKLMQHFGMGPIFHRRSLTRFLRLVVSVVARRRNEAHAATVARTDVAALNGGLGGTETQTDVLVPSAAVLARSGALGLGLGVLEDVRLLLESALRLDGQLGGPEVRERQVSKITLRV